MGSGPHWRNGQNDHPERTSLPDPRGSRRPLAKYGEPTRGPGIHSGRCDDFGVPSRELDPEAVLCLDDIRLTKKQLLGQ